MAALLDRPATLSPHDSRQLAARALGRCLLGIGPVDRLLAIVDGASDDRDGSDSAGKLSRLVALFGWGALDRPALEVTAISRVTAADGAAARHAGGAMRPVVFAALVVGGVEAFAGPAFLPSSQPLATLAAGLNGIRLDGRHVSDVCLSGPDLGLDVIAAIKPLRPVVTRSPVTPWFARVTFPGVVPPNAAAAALAGAAGLTVEGVVEWGTGGSRWFLVGPHSPAHVDAAARRLADMHRMETVFFRRLA